MTVRLIDCEASFIGWDGDPHFGGYEELPTMQGADGVTFFCPFGGKKACSIVLWSYDVPASVTPGPGRWEMTGTGLHDLTLHPSVDMSRGSCACKWHGWIKNGVCS
jgi:hypothetical protein